MKPSRQNHCCFSSGRSKTALRRTNVAERAGYTLTGTLQDANLPEIPCKVQVKVLGCQFELLEVIINTEATSMLRCLQRWHRRWHRTVPWHPWHRTVPWHLYSPAFRTSTRLKLLIFLAAALWAIHMDTEVTTKANSKDEKVIRSGIV